MSNANDFIIENGVLKKYVGSGGDVVIPEDVTEIGKSAFYRCSSLTSVTIPEGVTKIGSHAFCYCESLISVTIPESVTDIGESAFTGCESLTSVSIPGGVTKIGGGAFYDCSSLTSVTIPNGVTKIGSHAFFRCESLTSVSIPESVTKIEGAVFSGCKSLTSVTIPESVTDIGEFAFNGCSSLSEFSFGTALKLPADIFGHSLPKCLEKDLDELVFRMENAAVLEYVVENGHFNKLDMENQVTLMLSIQGKTMMRALQSMELRWGALALIIRKRIHDKYTAKECNAVANLMVAFCDKFPEEQLRNLYSALKPLKNSAKAMKSIADCSALINKLSLETKVDENLTGLDKLLAEKLRAEGMTRKELLDKLKSFYGIEGKQLPELKDAKGEKVDFSVLAWLLTAHEKLVTHSYGNTDVIAAYEKPGTCPEVGPILTELDTESFMNALRDIGKNNLGLSGHSKKMFLAYPICRYADEKLMEELTKTAPKWRSSVSGNAAPPLFNFRRANLYSNTRASIMFADRYNDLDYYAAVHGTDADTIRDMYFADVGLDADGGKAYDLGNQTVVARLQDDLSFLVELPGGKTAKSLPKKGADSELYAKANADFSEMKKAVKKVLKNRNSVLLQDFLNAKGRDAKSWKIAYLDNVLLRRAAKLLVWVQDKNSFTVTDTGLIRADGSPYELSEGDIILAHPMEMAKEEVKRWQDYYISRGLKQPFEQIWEPVVDPENIRKDRYKGCMIPYYRFTGRDKHGIHVADYDFHSYIKIRFDDCISEVERIDPARHDIDPNDRFEVKEFYFKEYTRKTNHIAAYLDKVTIVGRIAEDDMSIADRLANFTLAQITGFINFATENNCPNCTALLLDYKNTHFGDAEPMNEFVLEW